MDGLLKIGSRKPLELPDLWDLAHEDESEAISKRFQACLAETVDDLTAPQGVVWKAVAKTLWRKFGTAGVIKFVHDIIMFAGALKLLTHNLVDGMLYDFCLRVACVLHACARCMAYNIGLHCKAAEMVECIELVAIFASYVQEPSSMNKEHMLSSKS